MATLSTVVLNGKTYVLISDPKRDELLTQILMLLRKLRSKE